MRFILRSKQPTAAQRFAAFQIRNKHSVSAQIVPRDAPVHVVAGDKLPVIEANAVVEQQFEY